MNKYFLIFLMSIAFNPLFAQLTITGNAVPSVQFKDANGRILSTGENNIKGNQYVFDKFGLGKVIMSNGLEAIDSNLNFSLLDHRLYFLKDNSLYYVNQSYTSFSLIQKDADNAIMEKQFNKGYPAIDQFTPSTFYEVLAKGNNFHFLKYSKAFVKESTPYGSAPIKEYTIDHTFFLYDVAMKQMSLIGSSLSVKNLKKALPNYATTIDQYLDQFHLNIKKEADLRMLLEKLQ